MFGFILRKIMGTQNERELRRLRPLVDLINSLEPKVKRLSDHELRAKTDEFKARISEKSKELEAQFRELEDRIKEAASPEEKEKIKERLKGVRNRIFEDVLPEAFAVVREVARRTIDMRHFDVQIMGGIVLHQGKIAEMATGEGKTLVATLPIYLNALTGKGVHLITVNDYLARRDTGWMGPIYQALGLSVAAIGHELSLLYDPSYTDQRPADERLRHLRPISRKEAYLCDVTYGTNNEFGFDYLRDNMAVDKEDIVQRQLNYAIVDEVDSILIDEARTPLIISGPSEESTERYYIVDKIVPKLKGRIILEKDEIDAKYRGEDLAKGFDYIVDEKAHTASLTEEGIEKAQKFLGTDNLFSEQNFELIHHINQALRAHNLFKRDVDYVVKEGEVIIVDEFTGRLMPGRRWSDGLHQAIEAKEAVRIERENQTLATITFQNYFRMYEKLAGMTGTAATEATEFRSIYKLDCVVIPTNRPLIRTNFPDVIYKTQEEKFNAVVEEIAELYKQGRPILVGTISIDKSERLSALLKKRNIPHHVLNAKYHEMEAQIVAQTGRLKAVTIATNMAGRGTDILLGGNLDFFADELLKQQGLQPHLATSAQRQEVLKRVKEKVAKEHEEVVGLGGLHIIGTERHEARRIDNQLRGRAGRQGDPGSSRFYLSLEDDLMRVFGSDRIARFMEFFRWEEGVPIEHNLISKSVATAQKRVESYNFEIRKQLLEYDNVMNRQREVIYEERRHVLMSDNLRGHIIEIIEESIQKSLDVYLPAEADPQDWDMRGLSRWLRMKFDISISSPSLGESRDGLKENIMERIIQAYQDKEDTLGSENMRHLEKVAMLRAIDSKWKDHLYAMDILKEGIGLRAYGQRDPLIEYQHEAYGMFSGLIERIKEEAIEFIFKVRAVREKAVEALTSVPQEFLHPQRSRFGDLPKEAVPSPGGRLPSPDALPETKLREAKPLPFRRQAPKVGRNEPCPCGSGKKYKRCCGR